MTLRIKLRFIKYSWMLGMSKAGPGSPVLEFIFNGIIGEQSSSIRWTEPTSFNLPILDQIQ